MTSAKAFVVKTPIAQQPPSFVVIILLTAFYTAFNKSGLPALHHDSQQTGWKMSGGGEAQSLEALAGKISPDQDL
jgi:hypothetical protein